MVEQNNISILIVDDEQVNLMLMTQILKGKGYEVLSASSGEQTIEILEEKEVQAVLLDILMPGMDGFEVLRKIRGKKTKTDLPVIMLTAQDDNQDVVQAMGMGANSYLRKPVDPIELDECIRKHVNS